MAHWASFQGVGSVNPLSSPQTKAVVCRRRLSHWGKSGVRCARGGLDNLVHALAEREGCKEGLVWASICGWWWGSGSLGA